MRPLPFDCIPSHPISPHRALTPPPQDVRALGRGVTYYYRFALPPRTPGGPTPTRALARALVYDEGFDVVKVLKPVHLRTAENPIPFFYFVRDDTEKDGLRQCMKVPPERRVGRDPREVMLNSWFNFESSPPCRGYQYNQDGGSDAPVVHVLTRSSRSGEHSQYIYTQGFCLYSLKLVLREDGNLMRLRGRGYFELDQQPAELDSPPAVDSHRDVDSGRSLVQVARDNWKRYVERRLLPDRASATSGPPTLAPATNYRSLITANITTKERTATSSPSRCSTTTTKSSGCLSSTAAPPGPTTATASTLAPAREPRCNTRAHEQAGHSQA